MRDIHANLTAEQIKASYEPVYKAVFSKAGEDSVTFDQDDTIKVNHPEQPWSNKITIRIHNGDKHFESNDYKGWILTMYYGADISGDTLRYSYSAPLRIISQETISSTSEPYVEIEAIGAFDIMGLDGASDSYVPDEDDANTIKDLLTAIAGATLGCFNHCIAFTVIYDSEDGIIDSYQPKDSFRIYQNGSRLAAFRRLLDPTGCVARLEEDGNIHVFVPVTSGDSYNMEFKLDNDDYPNFYAKAYRTRVVIPNYVVVESQPDDDPQYSGYATDASYEDLEIREYHRARLQSNDEATAMAESLLSKYQLHAQNGMGYTPLITNLEVFDYVKITDNRMDSNAIGNIGSLERVIDTEEGEYTIKFQFGAWLSLRKTLRDLENTTDLGNYFGRLWVKDLYAENINADNIDMVWIDPDGNVDLSQIGDDLDNLADGEVYARVKAVHLDAGQIKLDDAIYYASGYDPTDKFDLGDNTLDDVPEGTTYKRVLSTQISAGKILLSDQMEFSAGYNPSEKRRVFTSEPTTPYDIGDLWVDATTTNKLCTTGRASGDYNAGDWTAVNLDSIVNGDTYAKVLATDISAGHILLSSATQISGEWYDESGVSISASYGVQIYGSNTAFTTRASKGGAIQCYVGSDGSFYAGGGAVFLNSQGLHIQGQECFIKDYLGIVRGYIFANVDEYVISSSNTKIRFLAYGGNIQLDVNNNHDLIANVTGGVSLKAGGAANAAVNGYMDLQATYDIDLNAGDEINLLATNYVNVGGDGMLPVSTNTRRLGSSSKAWVAIYGFRIYAEDGAIHDYHAYDDLSILRRLKTRQNKDGRDVIDGDSLPDDMMVRDSESGQSFVSIAALQGYGLGVSRALLNKIEALEAEVVDLRKKMEALKN